MLVLLVSGVLAGFTSHQPQMSHPRPVETAAMCMKKGEYTSGMNKICIYDCLGSDASITVSSVELCPLTINN